MLIRKIDFKKRADLGKIKNNMSLVSLLFFKTPLDYNVYAEKEICEHSNFALERTKISVL